jgi:hypothetical protein
LHILALLGYARDVLRSWQVIPPAGSTLERLVASVITRTRDDTFERIAARLGPELRQTIDELLVVPEDEARSPLFYLKAYPPEATPPAMRFCQISGQTWIRRAPAVG